MKRGEDFKRAMGKADRGFESRIHRTLEELRYQEEEKPVKKVGMSAVLAMAMVILLAAVAYAAVTQWGVLDYLSSTRQDGGGMLKEAAELVQSDVANASAQTPSATFALREAVFDGRGLFLMVAVTPANDSVMLMGVDALPTDPAQLMGIQDAEEGMTLAEYAAARGKTKLMQVIVYENSESASPFSIESLDYTVEADGTLVYVLSGDVAGAADMDKIPVEMICRTTPYSEDGDVAMEEVEEATMRFTLDTVQPGQSVASETPAVFADCGVRVDRVVLTGTAMQTHARVEFTVVDQEAYAKTDDGLWFEFIDDAGERLPAGASGSGSIDPVDGDEGTRFVQTETLAAMQTLPDSITLRGFNAWEKNRYEAHTFALQ